jgi:hypothetical protein
MNKFESVCLKKVAKNQKRVLVAQVVEHLLSKCKALSSNTSTAKKINK